MTRYTWFGLVLLLAACDSLPSWMGNDEAEEILPGERIAVLDYRRTLEADPALAEEPVALPEAQRNAEWKHETGPQLEGIENLEVSGFETAESVTIGEGGEWETVLVPQPVIGDGRVFAMDAQGYVTAHDQKDIGEIVWRSAAATTPEEEDITGGGLAYADGVVYIATGRGQLIALVAADGSLLWQSRVDVPIRAAPAIEDGRLFAVTIDNQLLAHDARTGKPLWSHGGIRESALYLGTVSPSVTNGIVVAAYTSGELYALRAEDGSPLWSDTLIVNRRTAATATLTGIDATPLIKGNTVYGISNNGLMVANLLTNGRGLWDLEISGHLTPWIAGDYLFAVTSDWQLIAVERKSGGIKWATSLMREEDGRNVTPGMMNPMVINGQVALATNEGELMLFSAEDGTLQRTVEIPDELATDPLVAGGALYLLTRDATLHELR